jgi:hypothetical protein
VKVAAGASALEEAEELEPVSPRLPNDDPPPTLNSRIVGDFPQILSEFMRKRFVLLWRGSRDGFGAAQFHAKCDGHPNTITFISDIAENVFGGFTPSEWEGGTSKIVKTKASPGSFLFSIKNPQNCPGMFPLKEEQEDFAIACAAEYGPVFGYGPPDIFVADNCNQNGNSYTRAFGTNYKNATGIDKYFMTGTEKFKVFEIEVFEIKD